MLPRGKWTVIGLLIDAVYRILLGPVLEPLIFVFAIVKMMHSILTRLFCVGFLFTAGLS